MVKITLDDKRELREAYQEDTVGRKYHTPIVSKTKWSDLKAVKEKEPVTYDLDSPMTKKEFQGLPADIQQKYIDWLHEKYNASIRRIGEMLGYNGSGFHAYAARRDLMLDLPKGKKAKMSLEQEAAWKEFLNKGKEEPETNQMVDVPVEPVETAEVAPTKEKSKFKFACDLLEFRASGELDLMALMNAISVAIPDGTDCKVYVRVEKCGDKPEAPYCERF